MIKKPKRFFQDTHRIVGILLLIYALICAVSLVGGGFKIATADKAQELFYLSTHPFICLFVGLLATSLVQSSSTVTSIIVGLVAGGLPMSAAIPMIMAANIGTTSTSTIVSFGHIKSRKEFKNAFAAGTIHDLFNILAVIILFPLELILHPLEKMSRVFASLFVNVDNVSIKDYNFVKQATKPVTNAIKHLVSGVPHPTDGTLLVLIGITIVFLSIFAMGKLLKKLMKGRAKQIVKKTVGRNDLSSFITGLLVTIGVQSSSTSTSISIPFAGNGLVSLKQIYPYTMGANIGTTVTALLASTSVLDNHFSALTIAGVHLLFNIVACLMIYFIKPLYNVPYLGAQYLSDRVVERKWLAIVYTLLIFYFIPALILFIF